MCVAKKPTGSRLMISVTFKINSDTIAHLYARRVGEHFECDEEKNKPTGKREAEYYYEIFRPATLEREENGRPEMVRGTVVNEYPGDLLELVEKVLVQVREGNGKSEPD